MIMYYAIASQKCKVDFYQTILTLNGSQSDNLSEKQQYNIKENAGVIINYSQPH